MKENALSSYDAEKERALKEKRKDENLVEFLRVSVNDAYDGNDEDGYYIPLHESNMRDLR